jgi:hypothetical protein
MVIRSIEFKNAASSMWNCVNAAGNNQNRHGAAAPKPWSDDGEPHGEMQHRCGEQNQANHPQPAPNRLASQNAGIPGKHEIELTECNRAYTPGHGEERGSHRVAAPDADHESESEESDAQEQGGPATGDQLPAWLPHYLHVYGANFLTPDDVECHRGYRGVASKQCIQLGAVAGSSESPFDSEGSVEDPISGLEGEMLSPGGRGAEGHPERRVERSQHPRTRIAERMRRGPDHESRHENRRDHRHALRLVADSTA